MNISGYTCMLARTCRGWDDISVVWGEGRRGNNAGCVNVHNGRHNMPQMSADFKSNTETHIKCPNSDIFVWR